MSVAQLLPVGVGHLDHLGIELDSHDPAGRTHSPRRNERIHAGAGSQIYDPLSRLEPRPLDGTADAREGRDRAMGHGLEILQLVPVHLGGLPAGVEVIVAVRVAGDLLVHPRHFGRESGL